MASYKDQDEAFNAGASCGFVIGIIIGFVLMLIVYHMSQARWQREAVEHDAAEYSITTGEWQWKVPAQAEKQ